MRLWKITTTPNASGHEWWHRRHCHAGQYPISKQLAQRRVMKYQASGASPYLSQFIDCTFEVNDNLRQNFLGHLLGVEHWPFRFSCTFRDTRSQRDDVILTDFYLIGECTAHGFGGIAATWLRLLLGGVVLGGTPTQYTPT